MRGLERNHRVYVQSVDCVRMVHALQNVERLTKEVYGDNYAENHPEAEVLKRRIYEIFEAKTNTFQIA